MEMNNIEEKIKYTSSVLGLLRIHPEYAGEIYSDLPANIANDVRYWVLQDFLSRSPDHITSADIPEEVKDIIRCWCCDKPLRECLTLEAEGWTYTKHESDPYIFDRARALGMTYIDENGYERIHTCGFSYT
ncbi:MAG: hypothetical protein ABI721_05190 [Candidatus Dojkabacteria bacterium]